MLSNMARKLIKKVTEIRATEIKATKIKATKILKITTSSKELFLEEKAHANQWTNCVLSRYFGRDQNNRLACPNVERAVETLGRFSKHVRSFFEAAQLPYR